MSSNRHQVWRGMCSCSVSSSSSSVSQRTFLLGMLLTQPRMMEEEEEEEGVLPHIHHHLTAVIAVTALTTHLTMTLLSLFGISSHKVVNATYCEFFKNKTEIFNFVCCVQDTMY